MYAKLLFSRCFHTGDVFHTFSRRITDVFVLAGTLFICLIFWSHWNDWSAEKDANYFGVDYIWQSLPNVVINHSVYAARIKWLWRRKWLGRWKENWVLKNASRFPHLTVKRRLAEHLTTIQPNCPPAASRRPRRLPWETTTPTTATGTALWTPGRTTLSTSRPWATLEEWVFYTYSIYHFV